MRKLAYAVAGAAVAAFMAAPAMGDSLPSSKVAAALGDLSALPPAEASGNDDQADTDWVPVARTFIKTANQKDLAMDMALQCGLVTDTTVKSKGGGKDKSEAEGTIRVRIKVTDEDGNVSFAEPSETGGSPFDPNFPATTGPSGVTYCERFQKLEAEFAGLDCFVDTEDSDGDGSTTDIICNDEESLRLLQETLSANAFNFLLADVSSGVQTVEVEARAQASTDLGGTELGDASAEAFVGLGSLLVEEIRLVKDADGTPVLQ